jgi:hypothetical protein
MQYRYGMMEKAMPFGNKRDMPNSIGFFLARTL